VSNIKGEDSANIIAKHMLAVSTNVAGVTSFGISEDSIFGFWDWVGGRYSVWSAVGVMPLALQYGFDTVEQFLAGARDMDTHVRTAPARENLGILMGMLGVWNSQYLGHSCELYESVDYIRVESEDSFPLLHFSHRCIFFF
jgi:glucose-6-phosphate isomerase